MGVPRMAWLLAVAWAAASVTAVVAARDSRELFSSPHAAQEDSLMLRRASGRSLLNEEDVMLTGGSQRSLLHGCHSRSCTLPRCARCRFPRNSRFGHCRANQRRFTCGPRGDTSNDGNEGNEGDEGRVGQNRPRSVASSNVASGLCPNLVTPPPLLLPVATGVYGEIGGVYGDDDADEGEYEDLEAPVLSVLGLDLFGDAPEFRAVATAEELQDALRAGANHVLITEHLDATAVIPEPDIVMREALNSAVGRVRNTTLSIAGQCDEPPPESFQLTEPMPPGACAILVKEDFLDAPLGTTCLLLDSLYIALASRESSAAKPMSQLQDASSSVLLLHVDGLMWINNCVFQGSGGNTRAVDTNTINGGRPELYIKDTTFTTFRRTLGPGIRVLTGGRLFLDNVIFRDIVQPRLPSRSAFAEVPQASAIAASDNVLLVLVNVTIEGNEVLGEPAGVRAIAILPSGTEVFADSQIEVWQWPNGPPTLSSANTAVATSVVNQLGRPQLEAIQSVQQEIVQRGLMGGDGEF